MSIALNQFQKIALGYSIGPMFTISETRIARLSILERQHGHSLANLNDALELSRTDSTLSQIRTRAPHSKTGKPRAMGDDLARKIELKLGLPVGWMDTPPTLAEQFGQDDIQSKLGTLMARMPPSDLERAYAVLNALSQSALKPADAQPTDPENIAAVSATTSSTREPIKPFLPASSIAKRSNKAA